MEKEMMDIVVGIGFHSARDEVGAAQGVGALIRAAGPVARLKENDTEAAQWYAAALRDEARRLEGEADALPFPARRIAVNLLRLHGHKFGELAA